MSVVLPAIQAKMGSITYYETVMRARELARTVRPASELDRWADMTIEERMQRQPNIARIQREIAPYLARHPDRFFGSFIVLVKKGSIEFESLEELGIGKAYSTVAKRMGFLTVGEGEHIALDGQHRLLAFSYVISNSQQLGEYQHEVGNDEVCVLIIEHDSDEKTRRIFNKVNRHAKPTSQSDNIITSEDDGYAIVTRRLLHPGEPLAPRQLASGERYEPIEWQKNTLSASSRRFTTLKALYETVVDILSVTGFPPSAFSEKQTQVAPPEDLLDAAYEIVERWWSRVLRLPEYATALTDPDSIPGRRAADGHPALMFRPAAHITMVKGLCGAFVTAAGHVELDELVRRLGLIDWSPSIRGIWRDVLVRPDGAMIAKSENYELGARLVEYLLIGDHWSEALRSKLWEDWNAKRGRDPYSAPDSLSSDLLPEDLPLPVAAV